MLNQLKTNDEQAAYVAAVLGMALNEAALASGIEGQDDLVKTICDAADASMVKTEADLLRAYLDAFRAAQI